MNILKPLHKSASSEELRQISLREEQISDLVQFVYFIILDHCCFSQYYYARLIIYKWGMDSNYEA